MASFNSVEKHNYNDFIDMSIKKKVSIHLKSRVVFIFNVVCDPVK